MPAAHRGRARRSPHPPKLNLFRGESFVFPSIEKTRVLQPACPEDRVLRLISCLDDHLQHDEHLDHEKGSGDLDDRRKREDDDADYDYDDDHEDGNRH